MGIRFSTKVGKSTSVSFPAWMVLGAVLLAVITLCAIVRAVVASPMLLIDALISVVIIGLVGVAAMWSHRRAQRR